MRSAGLAFVVAIMLSGLAPAAQACVEASFNPDDWSLLNADPAAALYEQAAYVEVAEIESRRPFDFGAWIDRALKEAMAAGESPAELTEAESWYRMQAQELSTDLAASWFRFRVVERLKGNGASHFELAGIATEFYLGNLPLPSGAGRHKMTKEILFRTGRRELQFEDFATSCNDAFQLHSSKAQYLVFRGADGRLLGPSLRWRDNRDGSTVWRLGPALVPVEPDDRWLAAVRAVAR